MRIFLPWLMGLAVTLASAGCLIVSRQHLDSLSDGSVAQPDGTTREDAPSLAYDDSCGSPTPRLLLTDTTRNIMIDTAAGYTSRNRMSCGASTPGNDVFIGLDANAGQVWHFHLTAITPGRQPMLYLTQASTCDSRTCNHVSTACDESGDEHFAFVATTNDIWYIGIDDGAEGGGTYILEAYRPSCGDGAAEHGESCDDRNVVSGDGCDRQCRKELSEGATMEFEPNDNRVEANALVFPASSELEITGSIGGPGACRYPDVFVLTVPDLGDVQVDALNPDGTACASRTTTPFDLSLERSSGVTVVSMMQDASGCSIVRAPNLGAGEYFVRVALPAETTTATPYRLRFRILP